MKRKIFLGVLILTGLVLVTGCSFKVSKYIPSKNQIQNLFKTKAKTVVEKTYNKQEKQPDKSIEEVSLIVNRLIEQTVDQINKGDIASAIKTGEQAYTITTDEPAFKKVSASVYTVSSVKEKLYETLGEAYDYKNHIDGLSKDEKVKYMRAARAHFNINPADPFKKHALARVLIETGNLTEGVKLATEVYNSQDKNKDAIDTYGWGLYLNGERKEAYDVYKTFWNQSETLIQMYHSAVVLEEYDKALGLIIYKGCESVANNLMVNKGNINNLSAQSYINKISSDSKKAADRLLIGGTGVDAQFKSDALAGLIQAIAKL